MVSIFVLFYLSLSTKDFDYELGGFVFAEKNAFLCQKSRDVPPKTPYAFVSVFSGDSEPIFGYLQMLVVLGFSLKTVSPQIDRVLIIPDSFHVDEQFITFLGKVWTHILYRPFIMWPHGSNVSPESQSKLFKLQAWSLVQYEKVLLLGADIMVFSDLSHVFTWPTPSSAFDFYHYEMNHMTPLFNSDFFLLHPNYIDYVGLLETAIEYSTNPEKDSNRFGVYDGAVLNKYFQGSVHFFPLKTIHENGGSSSTIFGDPYREIKVIRVTSVHYGKNTKPWMKNRRSLYSDVWKIFASNFYEKLDIPFSIGPVPEHSEEIIRVFFNNAAKKKKESFLSTEDEDEIEYYDIYPVIVHSGTRKNITMLMLLLFALALMLKQTIGTSNPFNVFLKKMEKKIYEFVKLDEDDPNITQNIEVKEVIQNDLPSTLKQ